MRTTCRVDDGLTGGRVVAARRRAAAAKVGGEGKSATAYAELRRAVELAVSGGRADRAALAREHLAAIEPMLSKLVVVVPARAAALGGFTVAVDGKALSSTEYNQPVPADPGEHVIEASAAGRSSWTGRVTLGAKGDTKVATVPELAVAAEPATPVARPGGGSGRRVAGIVVGGVSLAAIGMGAAFGAMAIGKNSDAKAACGPSAPACGGAASLAARPRST